MLQTVEDIVSTLKRIKLQRKKCSVLIGAGCSVSAGIPSAASFIDIIKERFPRRYEDAVEKTYPVIMGQLSENERHSLIREFVDKDRINWGYIALAQLMKAGFVDRVLTTNFDTLLIRACALVGEFPAVYDLAISKKFSLDRVLDKSIIYLHGQQTGFVLINTPEEFGNHSKSLKPVFTDAIDQTWLIVGYSGESDPVLENLVEIKSFTNNLYWIGYLNHSPAKQVQTKLLLDHKNAHLVTGFDSDSFFVTLSRYLECFPPDLVRKPFTDMKNRIETLTPYTFPKTNAKLDLKYDFMETTKIFVNNAIVTMEPLQEEIVNGWKDYLDRNYQTAFDLQKKHRNTPWPEVMILVYSAYVAQGNELRELAVLEHGRESDKLFKKACKSYKTAQSLVPQFGIDNGALINWGDTLSYWARKKSGEEADRLFEEAYSKYEDALMVESDDYFVLHNWGNALALQASIKKSKEAGDLLKEAGKKFQASIAIKPDEVFPLLNWGDSLSKRAMTKNGKSSDDLFNRSYEKYEMALSIDSNAYTSYFYWADSLNYQASRKAGAAASSLYAMACEKWEAGLNIRSDDFAAFIGWGISLFELAKTMASEEASGVFLKASEKFDEALKIKPSLLYEYSFADVLMKWGSALYYYAIGQGKRKASNFLKLAEDKFRAVLRIDPNNHAAISNWGDTLFARARTGSKKDGYKLLKQARSKYLKALSIEPEFVYALNNLGAVQIHLAEFVKDDERFDLQTQAEELFLKSESIIKGSCSFNLACLYARNGNVDKCKKWLIISKRTKQLPFGFESLVDFDSIRNLKWFQAFQKKNI